MQNQRFYNHSAEKLFPPKRWRTGCHEKSVGRSLVGRTIGYTISSNSCLFNKRL